ncbi:deleted in malignant brain tumors 1 protein-like [Argonauta hians]
MYEVIYTRTLLQSSKCVGNESSLAQCPGLVWSTSCASKKMLGLKLSRDIRLASHTPSRGRVEILHNQVWGGICGDKWTKEDATVTCKNLGFIKGKVLPHQKRHSGKVWLSEMRCTNNDTYLLNCPHDSWGFIGCSSTDRAAVQCFRHDIRLRGGSKPNEGRVEFKKNGIWGTLCDSDWDNDDATVLCRDLGYSQGTAYKGWKFGPGKGPIFHENVDCVGDELTFEQCFLQDWLGGSKCDHSHDVGVACFNEKIRLTGVDLENKGAVEVSYGNGWGRVCSDHWDNVKANVLCRSLGYETGLSHQDNPYRQNTGTSLPVLLNVGDCNGNETSIFECSRLPNEKCNYAGAGVTCFKVDISEKFLPDNRIVVNYDGKIGTLCPKESWTWVEATTVCRMKGYMKGFAIEKPETTSYPVALSNISCTGKELSLDECSNDERSYEHCDRSSNLHVHCANVEARIDGRVNNATVGLVQVLYNGLWGSVCNTGWNDDAAEVFCRSLGYCNGAMVSKYVSHIPVKNTHQFWLDNITCSGNETSLEECKHSSWGDAYCDQEDSAAAWCSNYVGIRLKDGKSKHEGRVEILHNGMWGSICDDSWDDNDARVVCRMLGYSYGRATLQSQHGLTNGEIWLDEVDCNGRELSIESCRHLEWGWHNCDHNEDAGVICSHNPTSIIG